MVHRKETPTRMTDQRIVHPWFRPLRWSNLLTVAIGLSLIGVGVLLTKVNHPRMASSGRMVAAIAGVALVAWCCYKSFQLFRTY